MQTVEIAPGRRIRVQGGPPCPHLGEPTDRRAEWQASEDRTVLLRLYTCSVHGDCTTQQRVGGHACCNGCPDRPRTDPVELEWVGTADLIHDAIRLAATVPPDVSGVAGIPRSGMIPASVIATHLHLPLYELTPAGELRRLGHGGRGREGFGGSAEGPMLVVDDTVYAGSAMRRAREAIQRLGRRAVYAAVYDREQPLPESRGLVDLWGRVLPSPHLLEWNICNNGPLIGRARNPIYRKGVGLDLDGVILHDQDSGGKPGGPYLLPRTHPAPLIATGRHERHRAATEAQLRSQGAQWQRLEMLPDDVPQTDEAIAAHKAKHFVACDLGFFVESDPEQAKLIAEIARRPVICPQAGHVFQARPRDSAPAAATSPTNPRRLAAVTTCFNPAGYRRIAANYRAFAAAWQTHGIPLFAAELAFDDQPFTIPDAFLQLRGNKTHLMWQKERLLNLLVERLPAEFDVVVWADADTLMLNPEWPHLAAEALSSNAVVQLWTRAHCLDAAGKIDTIHPSITSGLGTAKLPGHPGFNWAARREMFPVYDQHVCGGGDYLLWCAWTGTKPDKLHTMNPAWEAVWRRYADRSRQSRLSCIPGDLIHLYHGSRENRRYADRWRYLADHEFDPDTDIRVDPDTGLYQWCSDKPEMHRKIADYFTLRREDD